MSSREKCRGVVVALHAESRLTCWGWGWLSIEMGDGGREGEQTAEG